MKNMTSVVPRYKNMIFFHPKQYLEVYRATLSFLIKSIIFSPHFENLGRQPSASQGSKSLNRAWRNRVKHIDPNRLTGLLSRSMNLSYQAGRNVCMLFLNPYSSKFFKIHSAASRLPAEIFTMWRKNYDFD